MRIFRAMGHFCKAKTYIKSFGSLQTEVNRLQLEVLQKKEEFDEINKMRKLNTVQFFLKQLTKALGQTYEYQSVQEKKSQMSQMVSEIRALDQQAKAKADSSLQLKKHEQQKTQLLFLTDLTRFSQRYDQFLKTNKFDGDLQVGVELSHKALDNILNKEKVEWIGKEKERFDPEEHVRVEGKSEIIDEVIEKGFKIKGKIIEKAKVK